MTIAFKFPEAFKRGQEDCREHYRRVDAGEIDELDMPPNPYQEDKSSQCDQERHAYNAGWYSALPYEPEVLGRGSML